MCQGREEAFGRSRSSGWSAGSSGGEILFRRNQCSSRPQGSGRGCRARRRVRAPSSRTLARSPTHRTMTTASKRTPAVARALLRRASGASAGAFARSAAVASAESAAQTLPVASQPAQHRQATAANSARRPFSAAATTGHRGGRTAPPRRTSLAIPELFQKVLAGERCV